MRRHYLERYPNRKKAKLQQNNDILKKKSHHSIKPRDKLKIQFYSLYNLKYKISSSSPLYFIMIYDEYCAMRIKKFCKEIGGENLFYAREGENLNVGKVPFQKFWFFPPLEKNPINFYFKYLAFSSSQYGSAIRSL